MSHKYRRRLGLTAAIASLGAVALAPSAQAGPLVASAADCAAETYSQPFLPWADPANYVLAPGGDLEAAPAGWTLTGNAGVSAGNEPWNVHGSADSSGLMLAAGSSATTQAMCVGIEHPTLRFFARSSAQSLFSRLRVEVLFEDASGNVQALTIGAVAAGGQWGPTTQMLIGANLLALLPGERTAVAFRFTPDGNADWQIDDVYVDPYSRG